MEIAVHAFETMEMTSPSSRGPMDLSIVIVTYNSREPVEKCLRSIEAAPPSCEHEIVVVDNASSDGTPEFIATRFPDVRVQANRENTGYSRGVNEGIRLTSGRYVLVLNPDIEVREGSIDRLRDFMDSHPGAGIAGSKLVFPDGRVQDSCRAFYTMRALFLRRTFLGRLFPRARALREHLMTDFDHETARPVDWIIGACMMVRRSAIEEVGPMDERFFLYLEDTDWCFRMDQRDREVWYVPESVMVHHYRRSSAGSMLSRPFLIHLLSLMRYYEKWNAVFHFLRRHRDAIKSGVFVAADFLSINAAFLAAYYLRSALQPLFVYGLYPLDWYAIFIVFYNLLFFLTFAAVGLYRIRRETPAAVEVSAVIRSVLTVFAILLTATYLTRIRIFSRAVLLGQAFFTVITVSVSRRVLRRLHRELVRASFDLRRVVLAGTPVEAEGFAGFISDRGETGIDIVGRLGKGEGALGTLDDLPGLIDRFRIQELIVLPSAAESEDLEGLMTGEAPSRIGVRIVSPLAGITGRTAHTDSIDGMHMFSIERGAGRLFAGLVQRGLDIIAGLALLPLSVAVWVPLRLLGASTGRIRFFTERRAGAKGEFSFPRAVSAGGRELGDIARPLLFLQLLAGRVSLVGPPPVRPEDGLPGRTMRPGLTGHWRVEPEGSGAESLRREILILQDETITGRILLVARSVIPCLTGEYPDWFYSKGVDR